MSARDLTRRGFLQTAGAAVYGLQAAGPGLARDANRPNILYIMSDQQHWRAAGYRDRFFDTPHQDALARECFVFDNFFCATPQCSPSRSSMFTGWYPSKTGVLGNIGADGGNDLAMTTWGARLQAAGYRTGYFGKWHLGNNPAGTSGWDEEDWRIDDGETTAKAADFLTRHAGERKPFAMVASYLDPHDVYRFRRDMKDLSRVSAPLPDSWAKERFENKPPVQKQFMTEDQGTAIWGSERKVWEYYREYYRGKVKLFDNSLGEILQALKKNGRWNDTVVIVSSDHGDMDTNHRLIFKGPFMYEHMVRIPLLIRVPGTAPRPVTGFQAVNTDLAPTILDFAGIKPYPCHGRSLKPLLTGGGNVANRDFVIGQYYGKQKWVNPIRMIRTPEFKYNRYILHGEELYDLRNDPGELVNLAGDAGYAKRKAALKAELDRWMEENDDPFYSLHPTTRSGEEVRAN